MPLISEFQFTKEIEDRLLAPMDTSWLAVEKVVAGMIQALFSGLVVIPAAWLTLGSGVNLSNWHPRAIRRHMPADGAVFGRRRTVDGRQRRANADRPDVQHGDRAHDDVRLRVLSLERARFLPVLKYAVLINPLVYASEGMRGSLVPQVPHMPAIATIGALLVTNALVLTLGVRKFNRKAVS